MARSRAFGPWAYVLLAMTGLLTLGGVMMIYSASSVADYVKYGDSAHHLKKQLTHVLAGGLAMYVISLWDVRGRRRDGSDLRSAELLGWGIWGLSLAGLIAVSIIGVTGGGATSWLDLGPASIQPSEYAKLGCVILTAIMMVGYRRGQYSGRDLLVRLGIVLGPVVVLIMAQPDMGTTASLLLAIGMLLWLGGVPGKWIGATLAITVPAAIGFIAVAGYRMRRVTAFLDPWSDAGDSGYQIIQSLYAFGSGGLFGVGLGLSRQKYFYLPAAHTDFILAIIGEELGLLGALTVVAAFGAFAYAGMMIAREAASPFGRLLAGGLTAMITGQALINMAAVTGLMPITGIPLPFVSAGGSSLTLTLVCVGLILAVARNGGKPRMRLVTSTTKTRGSDSAVPTQRRRDGGAHLSRADRGRTSRRRRA